MKKHFTLLILVFLLCKNQSNAQTIILISKDKNENIKNWLLQSDNAIITKEFYFLSADSQQYYLKHCKGIVIGGGEDINPNLYKAEDQLSDCGKIDNYRDSIEYILINYALQTKTPILGICRGQQILNVATGGSLIVDIPKAITSDLKHSQPGVDSVHWVYFKKNSWLKNVMNLDSLVVNSSHHQAVNRISSKFKIAAISNDGIIEAIEWKDNSHPFAAAIQWHPERLFNDASKSLSKTFVLKVKRKK